MTLYDNISEQSQKRRRGVILSSQGWQRLQAAEYLSAARENSGYAYTLEQLSDVYDGLRLRTGISPKTLTKVRRRQSPEKSGSRNLNLVQFGCDWVRDYLQTNATVEKADSSLCENIL